MNDDFDQVMKKQSNAVLIEILNSSPGDYQPAALEAAKRELNMRNLPIEQIISVENENANQRNLNLIKGNQPLNLIWKLLSLFLPGIIPIIIAGTFKADGYHRKAKEVVKWTLFGFGMYLGLLILMLLLSM